MILYRSVVFTFLTLHFVQFCPLLAQDTEPNVPMETVETVEPSVR